MLLVWNIAIVAMLVCFVASLSSALGFAIFYSMVFFSREKTDGLLAVAESIRRWSVRLASYSFYLWCLTLTVGFIISVAHLMYYPHSD